MSDRVTVRDLRAWKERGERFAMVTAYDAPSARWVEGAGVPVVLVGDTVGDNVLGHATTVPVDLDTMLHHTAAVTRTCTRALVVADLPFGAYGVSVEQGLRSAIRLVQEGGAAAVKGEGGGATIELAERAVGLGVPFMGHLGLTPQSVHQTGYRVQARDEGSAERLCADAQALERAGAFALVLEAIPSALARRVTDLVSIPTIGIGAGPDTDAQVLVLHDLIGASSRPLPRFARRYAEVGAIAEAAVAAFVEDVVAGRFPGPDESYE